MLSIEGKRSFLALYWRAIGYLSTRLEAWFEEETITSAEYIGDSAYLKNVNLSAQCLCHKFVKDRGGIVEILTPSGALPRIHFLQLDGSFDAGIRKNPTRALGDCSIRHFETTGWQRDFFYKKILIETHYAIFDWEFGIVDVSVLQAAAENAARGRAQRGKPDTGQLLDTGLLALLRPYHGCPVVVPKEWLDAFPADDGESIEAEPTGSPKQRILEYFRANPAATKAEIKERLFPDLSHRKFQFFFNMASELEPTLSRPGRPKGA